MTGAMETGEFGRDLSSAESWYSVRCIFGFQDRSNRLAIFEERVTVWRAESFQGAIRNAEEDALEYAEVVGGRYLGLAQAYHLSEDSLESGAEVFSLMRESDLDEDEYLNRYFSSGSERQGQEQGKQ